MSLMKEFAVQIEEEMTKVDVEKARLKMEIVRILDENRATIVRRASVKLGCLVYEEDEKMLNSQYARFDNWLDNLIYSDW